ncbi:hypothetical protein [Bifidobacterium aquikefiri]|uniref:Uncharacterized protein n=1 Tax=Bifidobacterium aquikefiri TaxID=1653207 RepID=A0A261GAD1_9BIFI|nr:hypothetical protein [Bifidobacterium aquikefiri]OZG68370.1 hypothetical protein BAQU_0187 [Bifidobacterium aquikefiri]
MTMNDLSIRDEPERAIVSDASHLRSMQADDALCGRHLWLAALTTSTDPETGELLGLTIRDATTWQPLMVDAIFRPACLTNSLRPDGTLRYSWDPVTSGGITPDIASCRLPFSVYADRVQELLNAAQSVIGPHIDRDIRFLERQGITVNSSKIIRVCCNVG